jgi:hypothetical protein
MTRINCQNIHGNTSYTIEELSKNLCVSERQCSRWIASGLKTVDENKKPIFIMGYDVKEFIRKKNSKKKIGKLKRNQFYCLTCKAARNTKRGSIKRLKNSKIGICSVCNGKMSRMVKQHQKEYRILSSPTQMSMFD